MGLLITTIIPAMICTAAVARAESPLAKALLSAVREARFEQVIDFGPANEDRNIAPGSAKRIAHAPNVDLAVIQLDAGGRAVAWANVLLSRDYPDGLVVPVDLNAGAASVRFRRWDIERWNGGNFKPGNEAPETIKGWTNHPPLTEADDIVPRRTHAPHQFMAPYPASLFKLLVAFLAMRMVDAGIVALDTAYTYAVTNAPPIINLYEDLDFVFNTKFDFKGRFNGEPDYFSAKDETKGFLLATNFVPDAVNLPLITAKERGAGGGHIRFNFAKSSLNSHISQFPIGTYKKAHAHGPGAHVIILSGEGYSLMWPEGDEPRYYKWEVGTMIVPPNMWLHQHFNTGTTPARYLAFKHEGVAIRNAQGVPKAWISKRLGGDQIDYRDENPETRKQFAAELAKHGLTSKMDNAYAAELEGSGGKGAAAEEKEHA